MNLLLKGLLSGLILLPALVFAHGAPRLQVKETITLNADAETVWNVIKNFDGLHEWHPAVQSTKADGGNEVGANRTLTLKSGGTITETLRKFDQDKMSYMYQIEEMSAVGQVDVEGETVDIPTVPVSNYKSWVSVEAHGETTQVTWVGKFFRGYTGNHHEPKALNDDTAVNAITGFYQAGLNNLKSIVE